MVQQVSNTDVPPAPERRTPRSTPPNPVNSEISSVWPVENTDRFEIFSNGLRVENDYLTFTKPRSYRVFSRNSLQLSELRSDPAGIVFHTTESQMAPFESHHNASLKRNGLGALAFARENKLYNFVIDRFGRVYRMVAESNYAMHAGKSIWADSRSIYVNLNQSFLGVSFEMTTQGGSNLASPAQIHAARILTEMLRSKYGIPATNCVTHGQVSVNPQKMLIGYHTDWASGFPFRSLGLPDQYDSPLASITLFGFSYDSAFLNTVGSVWNGLISSDQQLSSDAADRNMTLTGYREFLQRRYREMIATLKDSAAVEETTDEGS